MKTAVFYGVIDLHNQEARLMATRNMDYEVGDIVVIFGYRVRIMTRAHTAEELVDSVKLSNLPMIV